MVVGCGGTGIPVAHSLLRLGVKHIVLIDGDNVESSNLNRQFSYSVQDIGRKKSAILSEKLMESGISANIRNIVHYLTEENASGYIEDIDFIFDCTDSISTKFFIAQLSREKEKILIHSGVDRDSGQVFLQHGSGPYLSDIVSEFKNEDKSVNTVNSAMMTGTVMISEFLAYIRGGWTPRMITIDIYPELRVKTCNFSGGG
ncbi:MAG: HesA/MoeB/ThiF family protein, partial [Candidatus Muiribacteriaceae bacterium]